MSDHNQEAERAAPGITDAEIAGIMGWRGPGVYSGPTLRKIRRVLEEDRARRAPAVGEDGLPPLPVHPSKAKFGHDWSAAEQAAIRQGQRDAVAADRRARGSIDGQLTGAPSPVKQGTQQPAGAAQDVKRRQDRAHEMDGPYKRLELACQEIQDLRTQLALKSEVLNGFAVVPIEPTKEMAIAGAMASENSHDETQDSYESYAIWDDTKVAYDCFKAMLAAAHSKKDM